MYMSLTIGYLLYTMRRRIRLIEGYGKSLRLKSHLENNFAASVDFSESPSPPKLLSCDGQAILWTQKLVPFGV